MTCKTKPSSPQSIHVLLRLQSLLLNVCLHSRLICQQYNVCTIYYPKKRNCRCSYSKFSMATNSIQIYPQQIVLHISQKGISVLWQDVLSPKGLVHVTHKYFQWCCHHCFSWIMTAPTWIKPFGSPARLADQAEGVLEAKSQLLGLLPWDELMATVLGNVSWTSPMQATQQKLRIPFNTHIFNWLFWWTLKLRCGSPVCTANRKFFCKSTQFSSWPLYRTSLEFLSEKW